MTVLNKDRFLIIYAQNTTCYAAFRTGFSDQSHFTNFFTAFIGISPGAYRDIVISRTNC
ncbi:helix-turn-helix domain-containing protein [Sedimentibacter hydroxybenzoicus]|uniref:helix-turn-helix domain-containing protein n=1 Tax=Sedimentibacter hydroxybenzoicus TaxID=29345 RepID=UPI00389ADBEF